VRYKDIICERWWNSFKIEDWNKNIDVYLNPSKSEFLKLIAHFEREHGQMEWPLRAFITPTNLYVWDAFEATHSDMSSMGIPSAGGYLYLNREGILFNDLNWDDSDGGEKPYGAHVRRYYEATMTNPAIRRIYGVPKITGVDDAGLAGVTGKFPITPEFIEQNCMKD
jgi:hypothetical protein